MRIRVRAAEPRAPASPIEPARPTSPVAGQPSRSCFAQLDEGFEPGADPRQRGRGVPESSRVLGGTGIRARSRSCQKSGEVPESSPSRRFRRGTGIRARSGSCAEESAECLNPPRDLSPERPPQEVAECRNPPSSEDGDSSPERPSAERSRERLNLLSLRQNSLNGLLWREGQGFEPWSESPR